MLPQTEIRNDTTQRLTGATGAGSNVFPSRTTPLPDGILPALLVYTDRNVANNPGEPEHGPVDVCFKNSLDLVIEAHTTGTDDASLDDNIDALIDQVQNTLLKSAGWVGQFTQVESVETTISLDAESEKRRGMARMIFTVAYMTRFALS